jgi:hypothetical protein
MTRRNMLILVTLLVALLIVAQTTVVTAHDVCGDPPGQWCVGMADPDTAIPVVFHVQVVAPAAQLQDGSCAGVTAPCIMP